MRCANVTQTHFKRVCCTDTVNITKILSVKMKSTRISIIIVLAVAMEIAVAEVNHHRRHHHHRHHSSDEQRSETSEDNSGSEESSQSNGVTRNSMERRLNLLEQSVKYLCLEDEDDVDRQVRHLGIKCRCPDISAEVCGSDGITYRNRCFLHCRAQHALLNYHRYRITLKKFGPC